MANDAKVQFRCTSQEKALWKEVAGGEGELSEWIVKQLNRASTPPSTEADPETPTVSTYAAKDGAVVYDRINGKSFRLCEITEGGDPGIPSTAFRLYKVAEGEDVVDGVEVGYVDALIRFVSDGRYDYESAIFQMQANAERDTVEGAPLLHVKPDNEAYQLSEFDDSPPEPEEPHFDVPVAMAHCALCNTDVPVVDIADHMNVEHLVPLVDIANAPVKEEPLLYEAPPPLDLTCANAVHHWRLTAGERCKFCGGGV